MKKSEKTHFFQKKIWSEPKKALTLQPQTGNKAIKAEGKGCKT